MPSFLLAIWVLVWPSVMWKRYLGGFARKQGLSSQEHALKSNSFHFSPISGGFLSSPEAHLWTFWASVLPSRSFHLCTGISLCLFTPYKANWKSRLFSCLFVVINILTKNTSITIATGSSRKHFPGKDNPMAWASSLECCNVFPAVVLLVPAT